MGTWEVPVLAGFESESLGTRQKGLASVSLKISGLVASLLLTYLR